MRTPTDEFLRRRTVDVSLRDGTPIRIRPVAPRDKQILLRAFERLSPEARYRRFMAPVNELRDDDLAYLTEIDYVDHYAAGALTRDTEDEFGIGVARYVRLPDEPDVAEAAVTVLDDYQRRGLGTLLLQTVGAVALENGITRFRGFAQATNRPVIDLLTNLGGEVISRPGPTVSIDLELPRTMEDLRGSPLYAVLRAVARGEAPPLARI